MNDTRQPCGAFPWAVRRRRLKLLLVVFATILAVAGSAPGQDRRRVLRAPGLVLNTAGPVAACHAVRYTADGRFLISAGEDKVVRIWPVVDEKLDRANARVLRWATWREQRGIIYAMDVYHEEQKPKLVAIGGFGLLNGTVAVLDFGTGEVLHGLTEPLYGDVVSCLAFAPDGSRVAYGTYYGRVLEWDFDSDRPNPLKMLGRHGAREENPIRAVHYGNAETLFSVAKDGSVNQWAVNSTPARLPALPALPSLGISEVRDVTVSGDGTRIAASGVDESSRQFLVEFRAWDGTNRRSITFEDRSEPAIVSLNRSGSRLAISVNDLPEDPTSVEPDKTRIILYDTQRHEFFNAGLPRPTNYVDALAFDPAGGMLAVAGGDDFEISVWNFAAEETHDLVRSRGSGLWAVGLSADEKSLGFKIRRNLSPSHLNDQGAGRWKIFDLESRSWANPGRQQAFEPIGALRSLDGWTVRTSLERNRSWEVVHGPSARRFRIPLVESRDGQPRCYSFLRPADGRGLRIAVGHRFGISIFELSPDNPPQLARLLIGHEGDVTAVAASEDGRILVSCSRDQTIAGWSLADWPNQAELGVTFQQNAGRLLVAAVAAGSPGWEAGLTRGDEIISLNYDGEPVAGGNDRMTAVLKTPIPGNELVFYYKRGGVIEEIPKLTTVRQRPLWRFFSTRDGEWVIWRWRDFFYDCSVRGDDLIGWQVNGGVDETPVFTRAEQYRRRFHRPEKVEEVLTKMVYLPERVAAPDLIAPSVRMRIEERVGSGFEVTIRADTEGGLYATEPNEVSLWINDHRFKRWRNTAVPFERTVWIPNESLRNSKNRVIAQVFNEHGVRGESSEHFVERPASQELAQLFGLCVGIEEYGGAAEWGNLSFTVEDAKGMQEVLSGQKDSGLYRRVRVEEPLLDAEATGSNIVEKLKRIAREVEPDDVFVLFMAGHGWARKTAANSIDEQSFVFVTADFNAEKDVETGVRFTLRSEEVGFRQGDTLDDLIADIRCRKLILLDCCHSGSIVGSSGDSMIRGLMPEGIGPAVIVACGKAEFSWALEGKVHGAFTQSVLEIFGDAFEQTDSNGDGAVTPDELAVRVKSRVPELIEVFRHVLAASGLEEGQTQRPRSYIPDEMGGLKALARGSQ